MQHLQDTLASFLLSKHDASNVEGLLLQTTKKQLLSVYENNYNETLSNALAVTFSACQALVGQDYFKWLSRKYIARHPSQNFNLEHYGNHFSNFVKSYGLQHDIPYLSEIAQLEWCMHLANHAADTPNKPAYNITELETIETQDHPLLLFLLPPSTQLLQTQYSVYDIWAFAHNTQEAQQAINLEPNNFYHVIFKNNFEIIYQAIDIQTYDFLVCLKQQYSFGHLCEILSASYEQEQILIVLSNTISKKLIQQFSILA